ncbi:hypothetical protein PHYPSEUDO_006641 [Phytophthora pseudosyringae]|uniref:Uncharacterized protein n=1 Tax=Phytophthora pseudosyringae TaxID=221518 RepID=A0A8T1WGQ2_9STRA|nr:hypothetical protein PHYPSEUDO_006641 [Phytophthora pseudosyringae]
MIRPVSPQQMQRGGQPQLRVQALLPPSSPVKHSSTTFPKSPIKKHLQNATVSVASYQELDCASASPLHGPLKAKLRASVLQAVLQLLDQDVNALAGAHEVLQAAAALPLAEPSVQRACVRALRGLESSGPTSTPQSFAGSSSNSSWDAYEAAIPPPRPRKQATKAARSIGRANCLTANSLHHCKEFLLACANEIHELEDVRPVSFDYAESLSNLSQSQPCGAANFDYASTVQESSDASVESDASSDDDDDDTRADQGSQFSEVLHRAEYLSDVDDDDVEASSRSMSMSDRVVSRKVLRALHEHVQSQRRRSSAPTLAAKFRVFEALKLQASLTRKRLAFQRFKIGLRSRPRRSPTAPNALAKPRSVPEHSTTFRTLLLHHSDALLLILALVFLANLPAKYIM